MEEEGGGEVKEEGEATGTTLTSLLLSNSSFSSSLDGHDPGRQGPPVRAQDLLLRRRRRRRRSSVSSGNVVKHPSSTSGPGARFFDRLQEARGRDFCFE